MYFIHFILIALLDFCLGLPSQIGKQLPMTNTTTTEPVDTTTTTEPTPISQYYLPNENIEILKEIKTYDIMNKLLTRLGPDFQRKFPTVPINSSFLPTVVSPLFSKDHRSCPDQFSRCSSQAYYPSCDLPPKTDSEMWSQSFNLYFNISEEQSRHPDTVMNATLRIYKNYSLPMEKPSMITVKLLSYTKSLTKRRDKKVLVTSTEVSSDYIGWVWLDVKDLVKNLKPRQNHGFLVTAHDSKNFTWYGPSVFVIMDCDSGNDPLMKALPFQVPDQLDSKKEKFPSLNIVNGFLKSNQGVSFEIIRYDSDFKPMIPQEGMTKRNHSRIITASKVSRSGKVNKGRTVINLDKRIPLNKNTKGVNKSNKEINTNNKEPVKNTKEPIKNTKEHNKSNKDINKKTKDSNKNPKDIKETKVNKNIQNDHHSSLFRQLQHFKSLHDHHQNRSSKSKTRNRSNKKLHKHKSERQINP